MIDTDSALYGRRLVQEIQKHSHDGVLVDTPIGRRRVYYAEFVSDSIQIRTAGKRTFSLQLNEWANAFSDRWSKEICADRHCRKRNTDEQSRRGPSSVLTFFLLSQQGATNRSKGAGSSGKWLMDLDRERRKRYICASCVHRL